MKAIALGPNLPIKNSAYQKGVTPLHEQLKKSDEKANIKESDRVDISESAKKMKGQSVESSDIKDTARKLTETPDLPLPSLPKKSVEESKDVAKTTADKKGNLKRPAIFFVPGLEMFSGSSGGYEGIRKMGEAVPGSRVYSWDSKKEMVNEIKKTHIEQPVILVGHSLGGDTAVEIANELNKLENGFRRVDLLVTIDSFGFNNDIVPSNVKKNLNVFSDSNSILNDGPNVARDHRKTDVINMLRSESHTELDDNSEVQFEIIQSINDILKNFRD